MDIGAPWNVLPPGVHDASLEEIEVRFATDERREALFRGLQLACQDLRHAGCRILYLDGSYVTGKDPPGDFDACRDPRGVDPAKLNPILLDFSNARKAQKDRYGGELFPSTANADAVHAFVDYFQRDRFTGKQKGIIRIQLKSQRGGGRR